MFLCLYLYVMIVSWLLFSLFYVRLKFTFSCCTMIEKDATNMAFFVKFTVVIPHLTHLISFRFLPLLSVICYLVEYIFTLNITLHSSTISVLGNNSICITFQYWNSSQWETLMKVYGPRQPRFTYVDHFRTNQGTFKLIFKCMSYMYLGTNEYLQIVKDVHMCVILIAYRYTHSCWWVHLWYTRGLCR